MAAANGNGAAALAPEMTLYRQHLLAARQFADQARVLAVPEQRALEMLGVGDQARVERLEQATLEQRDREQRVAEDHERADRAAEQREAHADREPAEHSRAQAFAASW